MISQTIEATARQLSPSVITDVFIVTILLCFLLAIASRRRDRHQSFTNYTPTLLTSLGILGTFLGIFVGLLEFDPRDIDASIPLLLEGLKTAFMSSVMGMFFSILYKGLDTGGLLVSSKIGEAAENGEAVDAADILAAINRQAEATQALSASIGGDGDSSLISQTKLLRTDLKDQLVEGLKNFNKFEDQLWQQMKDFGELLSKSATEQVIDALNQVIKDFNNNLTEQFGENFKKLNEAVVKLVDWQEEYRTQIEQMGEQYALGVKAIDDTRVAVANIHDEAKSIPLAMADLKNILNGNQHQIDELDRHLTAFKDVSNAAVNAVPQLRTQIDETLKGAQAANETLAKGMQESASSISDVFAASSKTFQENVDKQNVAMTHLVEASKKSTSDLGEALKSNSSGLDEMRTKLEATIQELTTQHRDQANKVFQGLEGSIQEALSNTGESVTKQVEMIDTVMGREIEKVMQSMGESLGQISMQFTNDYSKLVKAMDKIVQTRLPE
jgi:ABC-type transporter Mla subunit MlaD